MDNEAGGKMQNKLVYTLSSNKENNTNKKDAPRYTCSFTLV
jgi:hypothetical protein